MSPEFIKNSEDTTKYFIEFVKKLPDGTITSQDVQSYGPQAYLHSGESKRISTPYCFASSTAHLRPCPLLGECCGYLHNMI